MNIDRYVIINGEKILIDGTKRILKDDIEHQGIGGKEFIIEGEVQFADIVSSAVFGGNWACKNYLDRRDNLDKVPKHYYGKVGALGYLVGSDEFKCTEDNCYFVGLGDKSCKDCPFDINYECSNFEPK